MKYKGTSILARLRERKRLMLYLVSFFLVVAVQTVLYWWGMNTLEEDSRSLLASFEIVVQSLTTTGYGQDAPWNNVFLKALVIVMQFTGVVYLFIAFPLFLVPWIRETVTGTRVPRALGDMEDHVVLCGDSPLYTTLVEELEAADRPYVILADDDERARELYEDGKNVVLSERDDRGELLDSNIHLARACVVDATDHGGVESVLDLQEFVPNVEIVCLIADPDRSQYLRYAGATSILSPRHRLGKALADKARNVVTVDLADEAQVDESVQEFHVTESSPVLGNQVGDIDEFEATGATLVGAWVHGQFVTTFSPADRVDQNTILVAAGSDRELERVERVTQAEGTVPPDGPVLVVGNDLTGITARGILTKADRKTTVIGTEDEEGVDVVGDPTEPEPYHQGGIDEAGSVVLSLGDDSAAILATLVIRALDEDVEILVGAESVENENKLYSAGADYVLALPRLTGRMVMFELFEESAMTLPEEVRLTSLRAPELAGEHPSSDEVRTETGAAIVGVRRDGEVLTDFDEGFELTGEDELIVAGPNGALAEFESKYAN